MKYRHLFNRLVCGAGRWQERPEAEGRSTPWRRKRASTAGEYEILDRSVGAFVSGHAISDNVARKQHAETGGVKLSPVAKSDRGGAGGTRILYQGRISVL